MTAPTRVQELRYLVAKKLIEERSFFVSHFGNMESGSADQCGVAGEPLGQFSEVPAFLQQMTETAIEAAFKVRVRPLPSKTPILEPDETPMNDPDKEEKRGQFVQHSKLAELL
ncbi:hypothetical protein NDU88_003769 [Pleurodeles waltl]|uniref:Uncharacterized protein n=1 Tax=Pleurodeles waltl TaxID=8319 RepID=A0AAV7M591_PLEWA|nr:hypothetical protein NDU88_003769 [Pleurodeles waltl]